MRRILVIRYGGFGDLILSMGAFRTIRAHHQGDHIAVLTTRPFAERLAVQLAVAGQAEMLPPDLSWLGGDPGRFVLPPTYALIVPGGAPHRPEKRAPAAVFAALCRYLLDQGIAPVLLGTASERQQIT